LAVSIFIICLLYPERENPLPTQNSMVAELSWLMYKIRQANPSQSKEFCTATDTDTRLHEAMKGG
jgi:hypothetical protein